MTPGSEMVGRSLLVCICVWQCVCLLLHQQPNWELAQVYSSSLNPNCVIVSKWSGDVLHILCPTLGNCCAGVWNKIIILQLFIGAHFCSSGMMKESLLAPVTLQPQWSTAHEKWSTLQEWDMSSVVTEMPLLKNSLVSCCWGSCSLQ